MKFEETVDWALSPAIQTVYEAKHRRKKILQAHDLAVREARKQTLNKVREQANGSYEIRAPKEPENMIWEITEWQLKDILAELSDKESL